MCVFCIIYSCQVIKNKHNVIFISLTSYSALPCTQHVFDKHTLNFSYRLDAWLDK